MHDPGMTFFDEPDISRAAPKLKFFMIESEQVKYGCKPVVMINDSIDRMMGELVCQTVRISVTESSTGDPLTETVSVMIPANGIPIT